MTQRLSPRRGRCADGQIGIREASPSPVLAALALSRRFATTTNASFRLIEKLGRSVAMASTPPSTHAIITVDHSMSRAVYKGLAIAPDAPRGVDGAKVVVNNSTAPAREVVV